MNDDANVNVKIHVSDDSKAAVEEAKSGFAGLWKQVGGGVVAAQLVNDAWGLINTGIKRVLYEKPYKIATLDELRQYCDVALIQVPM